jgi:hypothetical protein
MSYAERNRRIKEVLTEVFGAGKVKVRGAAVARCGGRRRRAAAARRLRMGRRRGLANASGAQVLLGRRRRMSDAARGGKGRKANEA